MAAYGREFEYRDAGGAGVAQGACQLHFDEETCTVTPATGRPVTFDFGDVDEIADAGRKTDCPVDPWPDIDQFPERTILFA